MFWRVGGYAGPCVVVIRAGCKQLRPPSHSLRLSFFYPYAPASQRRLTVTYRAPCSSWAKCPPPGTGPSRHARASSLRDRHPPLGPCHHPVPWALRPCAARKSPRSDRVRKLCSPLPFSKGPVAFWNGSALGLGPAGLLLLLQSTSPSIPRPRARAGRRSVVAPNGRQVETRRAWLAPALWVFFHFVHPSVN